MNAHGRSPILRNAIVLLILACGLVVFVTYYQLQTQSKLKRAIAEHASILSGPLWNYDREIIDSFMKSVIGREGYQALRVFQQDQLFCDAVKPPSMGITGVLSRLGLVDNRLLVEDIAKDTKVIGRLELVWQDTTIYITATACSIAALLYVIASLYGRNADTNLILERKVEDLRDALEELRKQKEYVERLFDVVPQGLITLDNEQRPVEWNASFMRIVEHWASIVHREAGEVFAIFLNHLRQELQSSDEGEYVMNLEGHPLSLAFASAKVPKFDVISRIVSLRDITDLSDMQRRLSQAEKLESVGRLAAGIAHEINTPTQYVVSNLDFLTEAYRDIAEVMTRLESMLGINNHPAEVSPFLGELRKSLDEADWEYLAEEIPGALAQSREGLSRIQSIVGAMKRFTYPAGEFAEKQDLNGAIETTVTVTRNEWKYVAEVVLNLDPSLPPVPCYIDQFNQVILIMIINSVQAIEERLEHDREVKGLITISSRATATEVEVSLADNGIGMSKDIQKRIFDPFFTTKAVNKGTGQGLAIANDIIVTKHGGSIEVLSEPGKGSMFVIRLPLEPS